MAIINIFTLCLLEKGLAFQTTIADKLKQSSNLLAGPDVHTEARPRNYNLQTFGLL